MKKKILTGMLLAAVLMAQVTTAFARTNRSPGSNDSEPASATNRSPSSTSVMVNADGVKTTGITTSTGTNGSVIAVAVNTATNSGTRIRVNSHGEAVVGNKIVTFAKGEAATAGLGTSVVETINAINSGKTLSDIIRAGFDLTDHPELIVDGKTTDVAKAPALDLKGYNALTSTHALVTQNADTRVVNDTATETVIYVPNLIDGLGEVAVLYYDNATGRWLLLPVSKIDVKSKLVYVNVTGSGTLSVVYKK